MKHLDELWLGYAKPRYEPLSPTVTYNDPQLSKMFTLWRTMTHNVINGFIITENKVLGLFTFLNRLPKTILGGKFGLETSKCFV